MDDGSRDRSAEIVRGFREADPRVRLVRLKANAGETAATDAGFKAARRPRGRHHGRRSPERPARYPRHAQASRPVGRGDRLAREPRGRATRGCAAISSRVANRVRNALSEETIQDSGCTFRAFRRECLRGPRAVQGLSPVHSHAPQDARVPRARGAGESSAAALRRVEVRHRQPRVQAPSSDLLVVRWMKDRSLRYEVAEDLGGTGEPRR